MSVQDIWSSSGSDSTADLLTSASHVGCQQAQKTQRQQSLVPSSDYPESFDYTTAIDTLGTGKFHVYLALTCGYMFLAAGLQNNLNAYILPSVHCDLHISSSQMGLLNAVFLAGGILSGFLWGIVADLHGRKTVVVYGMFIDGVLTLCSSLSQQYSVLLIFRFLNGFVVGGPSSLVFVYMGEFLPDSVRATAICYVGMFWTLSWVIMPGMAWLVIPQSWSLEWSGIMFNSWRFLVALTSLPSLTAATLFLCFPESPKFLLMRGNKYVAVNILADIYTFNNNCDSVECPVKSLKVSDLEGSSSDSEETKTVYSLVTVLVRQAQLLFAPSTFKITALTSIMFFSNMYGYYGLGLWLPELFSRMSTHLEQHPGASVTICSTGPATNHSSVSDNACDPTAVDTEVFIKSVIMGLIGLLGNVISGVLAGHLHRRTMPVVLMGVSALCVVVIYFTTNLTTNLVMASTFQLTVGTANLVYNSLVVDMFPPNISGMGVCVAILAGRLGGMLSNLAFGHLLDVSCTIPIFICASVLFAGGIASVLIPKHPFCKPEVLPSASFQKHNQQVSVAA